MNIVTLFSTLLLSGLIVGALQRPAAAQAADDKGSMQETTYGAWTFFSRPDPRSKKTEYTIYNSALKTETVALMFRCTPEGLWGFIFDGVQRRTAVPYKVRITFDNKTSQVVEGSASASDPVIMLRVTDELLGNIAKAKTFSITASGQGPAQTYAFDNDKAQPVFLLFAHNCQE